MEKVRTLPLPTNRHFDCMKKCPLGCAKSCQRIGYKRLVAMVRSYLDTASQPLGMAKLSDIDSDARALLRELGEIE